MNKKQNKLACTVRKNVHFSRFAKISGIALFVVAVLCLLPPAPTVDNKASAVTTRLFATTQPAATLSVTTDKDEVSIDTISVGILATGRVAISTSTDNFTGAVVSANIGRDSITDLIHVTNSSKVIPSITSTFAAADFPAGYWGVSLDDTNFQALPASYQTGLELKNFTTAATNQTADLTIGAKASTSQISGVYTSSVRFTAVANSSRFTISYDGNTTDPVGNMPASQSDAFWTGPVTLNSKVPTRAGWTFLGWSEDSAATEASFAPSAKVYLSQTQDNSNIKLYAIWQRVFPTVTFNVDSSSAGYGTVDHSSVTVDYGSTYSVNGESIVFANNTIVTATPASDTDQYSYAFDRWDSYCEATGIRANCAINAYFTRTTKNYTVTWNANGGSVSPATTTKAYGATLGTLPTPTDSARVFQGWFTAASGGTQITSSTTVTGNVTYYAHWANLDITSLTYMQEVTLSTCANTPVGTQVQLLDSRDNKLYWVAKLADDNCWMTQNLDYDIIEGDNIISNNDGTTSVWTASHATSTSIFANKTATGTYSYDPGNDAILADGTRVSQITCDDSNNSGEVCHYHLGNYYQYYAATAKTGGDALSGEDAISSICPKGWRLPEGSRSGQSFGNLTDTYGITNGEDGTSSAELIASPLYFGAGGFIGAASSLGSTGHRVIGSEGHYWTAAKTYSMSFTEDSVSPENSMLLPIQQARGLTIRCVAHERDANLDDISTMQEMTPRIVAATPENASKQLIDTRDNKLYWVTKLKDGNIWMTQNLDYDIINGDNIMSVNDGTTKITTYYKSTSTTVFDNSRYNGYYGPDNYDESYDQGNVYLPDGTGTPTEIACTTTSNDGENCHYHVGNHYQWGAATGRTGQDSTNADQPNSICPKGWRLPAGGSSGSRSFGRLIKQYGYSGSDGNASESDTALLATPLYFTRGGYASSRLLSQGTIGRYWTLRAGSASYIAESFGFSNEIVYTAYSNGWGYRYDGYSVRCVAI